MGCVLAGRDVWYFPRHFLFQHLHCGQHPEPTSRIKPLLVLAVAAKGPWLHTNVVVKLQTPISFRTRPSLSQSDETLAVVNPGTGELRMWATSKHLTFPCFFFYDLMDAITAFRTVITKAVLAADVMCCCPGRSCPVSGTANMLAPMRAILSWMGKTSHQTPFTIRYQNNSLPHTEGNVPIVGYKQCFMAWWRCSGKFGARWIHQTWLNFNKSPGLSNAGAHISGLHHIIQRFKIFQTKKQQE